MVGERNRGYKLNRKSHQAWPGPCNPVPQKDQPGHEAYPDLYEQSHGFKQTRFQYLHSIINLRRRVCEINIE